MLDSRDEIGSGGILGTAEASFVAEVVVLLALVSSSMDDLLRKLVGHDGGVSDKAAGAVAGTVLDEAWSNSSRS